MNRERLRRSAEELETLLAAHAGESAEIAALYDALKPFIQAARAGTVTAPVDWTDIPGDRPFLEGVYSDFPDVETAYSRFKFLLSGTEHQLDSVT